MNNDAQRIAKIICERIAERDGIEIPDRFWQRPEWREFWALRCVEAEGLLKIYEASVIIETIRDMPGLLSLRSSSFLSKLNKQQEKKED